MASARECVFSTPELLEAVLIQLAPLEELLRAELISRSFHTAITSSPTLQQKLFFRPNITRHPKKWIINPLLRQHFVPWFVLPFDRWSMPDYGCLKLMDWTKSRPDAFLRADASWRKMLLVQPPAEELKVMRFTHGQVGDAEEKATVLFKDAPSSGVTMGILYDITESFLREEQVSSFGLSFKDSVTGPNITLYLTMTQQCCESDHSDTELKSAGAKSSHAVYELEWTSVNDGADQNGRLSMGWETSLTAERGGMKEYEWREWKRKRVSISDLVSDVR